MAVADGSPRSAAAPVTVLPQANAYAMIRRRAAAAGIATKLGNHSFRATGITAYLKARLSSINPALTPAAAKLSSTQPAGWVSASRRAGEEADPRIVVRGEMCEGTETARP